MNQPSPRDLMFSYLRSLPLPHFAPSVGIGPSRVSGCGLLARRDIDAGEILVVERGPVVDGAMVELIHQLTGFECETRIGWGQYLLHRPPQESNQGGYINHSCNPNVGMLTNGTWCAIRPIGTGDEVACDYGTFETTRGWNMDCHCGEAGCRKTVTARDFRLPELRARLLEWFAPYLRQDVEVVGPHFGQHPGFDADMASNS